jgi:integrase
MAGNKKKPEEFLFLQPDDAKKFLVAAYKYDVRKGALMDVMLNGGLRVSEALSIKAEDISQTENKIRITCLKKRDLQFIDLLYPSSTMNICRKLIKYLELKPSDRLFPWTRQWAWKCFKKILSICNLSRLYSPHALRHAHGIMIAEITKGDHIKIAKRLRHSSVKYVYTYTHLTDQIQKEIVEGIEKIMKK